MERKTILIGLLLLGIVGFVVRNAIYVGRTDHIVIKQGKGGPVIRYRWSCPCGLKLVDTKPIGKLAKCECGNEFSFYMGWYEDVEK